MSYKPPVTGRVKSIKSKFENLNSFESLDISSSLGISHLTEPQPRTSFLFKRSATSIELPAQKCRDKFTIDSRRHINAGPTDAFALKYRNLKPSSDCADDDDKLEPLKEIKENLEVRFNRHTSDPVKRGSIKRSPAFRVGDKGGKGVMPKSSAPVNKKLAADLVRPSPIDAEKLQEIGMTDTLKAVLKQPLPTGPPPKKPPRTFVDSPSPRENRPPAHMFARAAKADALKKSMSPPRELQNRIDFLENELVLKPKVSRSTIHGSSTKHKPFSSSLLRCIPCSSTPVYDTMTISRRTSEQSQTQRNDENRIDVVSPTSTLITHSLDKPKKNVSEHIYMEPFAHLKLTNLNNNNNTSDNHNHHHHHHPSSNGSNGSNSRVPDPNYVGDAKHTSTPFSYQNLSRLKAAAAAAPLPHNGSSLDNVSIDSSHVSCTSCAADDHSMSDLSGDIHYMVSSIETSTWAHGILGINRANPFCIKSIYGELCLRGEKCMTFIRINGINQNQKSKLTQFRI